MWTRIAAAILLVLGLFVLAPAFFGTAEAQGQTAQGWTVWQDGQQTVYPFKERWTGVPTAGGFTLKNSGTGVEVYYYGTFRVEHRTRSR
jgi:hypothetical protein